MSVIKPRTARKLTDNQVAILKNLKRAPKPTSRLCEQLRKKNFYLQPDSLHGSLRRLEDRGFVRGRELWNNKLKRTVITWEITDAGKDAIA